MDNKVLDEAVEVALTSYVNSRGSYEGEVPASSDDIRAALLAGMKVLLGEPVAYADPKAFDTFKTMGVRFGGVYGREWMWAKPSDGLVPVYAPSLGEGDGR